MNIDNSNGARRLFLSIGDINDVFLDAVEMVDISSVISSKRKQRMVKYSKVAAISSVGIAAAYMLLRPNKAGKTISYVSKAKSLLPFAK